MWLAWDGSNSCSLQPLTSRLAWMSDIETDTVLQLSQDCSFSVDEVNVECVCVAVCYMFLQC